VTQVFEDDERAKVGAVLDELVPGAAALGAVDYVERLLTALDHDPPRLWAAPGGWAGEGPDWLELGPWERHAWRERLAEWRDVYARVIDGTATSADRRVVHLHACEATYGDPAYGGNRGGAGWQRIDFPEPLFPPRRAGS
jgi:hypothetical protein